MVFPPVQGGWESQAVSMAFARFPDVSKASAHLMVGSVQKGEAQDDSSRENDSVQGGLFHHPLLGHRHRLDVGRDFHEPQTQSIKQWL
jgi:hypothetical protein